MTALSSLLAIVAAAVALGTRAPADDSPQLGRTPARNNVASGQSLPSEWHVGGLDRRSGEWLPEGAENIRWVARLGSQTYSSPVVAGEGVYVGTNNAAGHLPEYPSGVDLGVVLAFDRGDGRFLWQHSVPKHPEGSAVDWPEVGLCATPLVEGDRLWVVTNRGEVVCLDLNRRDPKDSRAPAVHWRFDLIETLGVRPRNMSASSVTAAGDLLLVNAGNSADAEENTVPAPDAPSFIALDKQSGELLWADASPGAKLLHGQWSSPAFAVIEGVPQAIFAGADGWVYSFRAERTATGRPELLWKFDANPKTSEWRGGGRGDRNSLVAAPTVAGSRVFVAPGQDPEHGEGPAMVWCIDATRRGDVSAELAVHRAGNILPRRRLQAVDVEAGELAIPNPNSAVAWVYRGNPAVPEEQWGFEETMHRSLAGVAVAEGLVIAADFSGLVHCLDAGTGEPYWTYDMFCHVWGSPLVADGRVYVGGEDGMVAVFALSEQFELLAENDMGSALYSTPAAAANTLFIATSTHLFAIGAPER